MELRYFAQGLSLVLDQARCVGCGRCVEVCPHGVFDIQARKASIQARERCMECGACALNCPAAALSVEKGVGCAAAIIGGFFNGGEPTCGCGCSTADECAEPEGGRGTVKGKKKIRCC